MHSHLLAPSDTRKPPIGALGTLSSPDRFLDLAPSQNSDLSRGSMTTTTPVPPLGGWHREMLREKLRNKGMAAPMTQSPVLPDLYPFQRPKVPLKIMRSIALHPELGIYVWMSVNNKLKYTESSNRNRF